MAVERSEERIINDLHALTEQGYKAFFCTTELFYYDKWKEIFAIAGYKSVRTNGYPFVSNPQLIDDVKKMGVKKVTFTANAGKYHEGLNLPKEEIVKKAIEMSNGGGLVTSVNILLNKKNFKNLEEMAEVYMNLGVDYFIFSRILPAEGISNLLETEDTEEIYKQVADLKRRFPLDKTGKYFEVSGEMGSKYRPNREKTGFYCPAGTRLLAIGLDDKIYPCSFMTQEQYRLGRLEDGKIILDKEFDMKLKDPFGCFAHDINP
jgi:MoaA/NifB/PqqE/SkfB family radical SAM enzyme